MIAMTASFRIKIDDLYCTERATVVEIRIPDPAGEALVAEYVATWESNGIVEGAAELPDVASVGFQADDAIFVVVEPGRFEV